MRLFRDFVLPLFLLFAIGLFAGCGGDKLESRWLDRVITIDGRDTDWQDARVYIEDASMGMGLLNDGEHLYLTLSLSNRQVIAQAMRQGFTVWFDPTGGRNKIFGIRFPLGLTEMNRPEGGERTQRMDSRSMDGRGGPSPEQIQAMFDRLVEGAEMEIFGPKKDERRRMLFAESREIRLKVSYAYGRLVYELKVLLAPTPLGIGTAPGKTIGLGFEAPELDMAAMRQQMGDRRGGGIRGDGGMRGGGMRGGGMRGGMMRPPEPFRLWTRIKLAPIPEG